MVRPEGGLVLEYLDLSGIAGVAVLVYKGAMLALRLMVGL